METACVDGHSRISVVIDPGHIRTNLYLYDKGKGVCVRDVCAIYDNNISPSLLMIIIKIIILYFIQIRHTDSFPPTGTLLVYYTIICLKSVGVRKLQVEILARSPREMSQTDRILPRYILSRVRVSVRPRIFLCAKKTQTGVACMLFIFPWIRSAAR